MRRTEVAMIGSTPLFDRGVSAYLIMKKQVPLVLYHDGTQKELMEQGGIYTATGADPPIPEHCTVILHVMDELEGGREIVKKCDKVIQVITQDKRQIEKAEKIKDFQNVRVIVRDYIPCKISDRFIRSILEIPKEFLWTMPEDYKDRKIGLLMQYGNKFSLHGISYAKREVMKQAVEFIEGGKL